MLVRATGRGFYHWIRNRGDEFEIPDDLFEPTWQEKLVAEAPAPPAAEPEPEPLEPLEESPPLVEEEEQP